jgi:hypothetical protein
MGNVIVTNQIISLGDKTCRDINDRYSSVYTRSLCTFCKQQMNGPIAIFV